MRTSFSFNVDTVEVPPAMPLRRARTVPDEGHLADLRPTDIYAGLTSPEGRPYEYPAPVYVRNTFVSFAPGRDPSLEGFFEERRIHSCPASWQPGEDEEDPVSAQPTRETTACGSASEGSAAASTPPLELSDTEDMSELIPTEGHSPTTMDSPASRAGANAHAAALPSSSTTFRKTVSEYRRSEDSQPSNFQQVAMQVPATHFDMVDGRLMQRQPLAPGPIQVTMQTPSNVQRECYYQDSYNAAFPGYDAGYEGVYDHGYDNSYSNGFVDNYDGGYNAGYQPGISYALVPDYAIGAGQEANSMHSDPRLAGPSQVVLQLSSTVYPCLQMPPPPGAPAPSPVPLPPPPAPPAEEPLPYEGQLAPTRGSLAHGLGRCKPCAFVHTKGCGNGFECPFCHLCEPGEKKKRRKDKLEARRVSREVSRAFPFGNSGSMGHGLVS